MRPGDEVPAPGRSVLARGGEGATRSCRRRCSGAPRQNVVAFEPSGALVSPPNGAPFMLAAGQVVDLTFGAFALRVRFVEEEGFASSFSPAVEASDYGGLALSALARICRVLRRSRSSFRRWERPTTKRSRATTSSRCSTFSARAPSAKRRRKRRKSRPPPTLPQTTARPAAGARSAGRGRWERRSLRTTRATGAPRGDNPRELQSLSRAEKQALVKDFGILGLLASMNADPNAPTVPWGDVLRGADRDSHLGGLFGPDPADSWGIGGLTLGGNDDGGGRVQPRRGDQRRRRFLRVARPPHRTARSGRLRKRVRGQALPRRRDAQSRGGAAHAAGDHDEWTPPEGGHPADHPPELRTLPRLLRERAPVRTPRSRGAWRSGS